MKTLSKIAVACLLLFASCSVISGWNTNSLALGMDKDTAYKSMGQKPASVVVAKQYASGTLEVVEYSQSFYNAAGTLDPLQKAWLYFSITNWFNTANRATWRSKKTISCPCSKPRSNR